MTPETNPASATLGFAVKLKQGDILKAIRARGWTQVQAAEFVGMHYQRFCQMINLYLVPRTFSDAQAAALVDLTGKLPEELFPEIVRSKEFQSLPHEFEFYREMTHEMLEAAQQGLIPSTEDLVAERERLRLVQCEIEDLPERTQQIIQWKMAEWSNDRIGEQLGLSGARVNQIYKQAIKKLGERLNPPPPEPPDPPKPVIRVLHGIPLNAPEPEWSALKARPPLEPVPAPEVVGLCFDVCFDEESKKHVIEGYWVDHDGRWHKAPDDPRWAGKEDE